MNWPSFRNSICLVIAISLFAFSCKKEKAEELQPAAVYTVETGVRINDIAFINDSVWLACGGIRNEYGVIYKTYDAGASWRKVFTTHESSIYTLEWNEQDNGFAGGDFLRLWQTKDAGETWQFYWLADQVPINEEDRPAIRDIKFASDSIWYFCGGENLYKGVFYHTENAGTTWNFISVENELRSCIQVHTDVLVMVGHGGTYDWNQQTLSLERSDFRNDYMTHVIKLDGGSILACTQQGKVYISPTKGRQWSQRWSTSRISNTSWNALANRWNEVLVVGTYGRLLFSSNAGNTWRELSFAEMDHLLAVKARNGRFYITTSQGKVLVLDQV
ncbi:MAG TPA: YCF48-related protein [Flavobacteriales bacterium]